MRGLNILSRELHLYPYPHLNFTTRSLSPEKYFFNYLDVLVKYFIELVFTCLHVSWRQSNPNAVFWSHCKWCVFVFKWNQRSFSLLKAKVEQQKIENCLQLHQRKSRSNAVSWSDSERHVSVRVDIFAILFTESFGIKFIRFREILRIVMERMNRNHDADAFFDVQSFSINFQVKIFYARSVCHLNTNKSIVSNAKFFN